MKCCDGVGSGNYVVCMPAGPNPNLGYGKWQQSDCPSETEANSAWCDNSGIEDECKDGLPVLSIIDLANLSHIPTSATAAGLPGLPVLYMVPL